VGLTGQHGQLTRITVIDPLSQEEIVMKKRARKLSLNRETLHSLEGLRRAVGGTDSDPTEVRTECFSHCASNCSNCTTESGTSAGSILATCGACSNGCATGGACTVGC